jgi:hypothetical protein
MTPSEHFVHDLEFTARGQIERNENECAFPEGALAPGVSLHLIVDGDNTLWLSGLESTVRGAGHVRAVLGLLTGLADDRGIIMRGNPIPYGEAPGLTRDELVTWYARHQFILEQKADEDAGLADIIRREPRLRKKP